MKEIIGLDSAYHEAVHSKHGANIRISAKLICEMAERIWELEYIIGEANSLNRDIALLFNSEIDDQNVAE